ncbi:MAG: glutaredoxin family protein [Pseudomonadota bacterium]
MATLTLYSRRSCPACEEMIAELEFAPLGAAVALDVIDVDSDAQLAAQYGWHVPVLLLDGDEVCRHELDLEALLARLNKPG